METPASKLKRMLKGYLDIGKQEVLDFDQLRHLVRTVGSSDNAMTILRQADTKLGYTALHLAALHGHDKVVDTILSELSQEKRLQLLVGYNSTPLHTAASANQLSSVKAILSYLTYEQQLSLLESLDTKCMRALDYAQTNQYFNIVELLRHHRRAAKAVLRKEASNADKEVIKLLEQRVAHLEQNESKYEEALKSLFNSNFKMKNELEELRLSIAAADEEIHKQRKSFDKKNDSGNVIASTIRQRPIATPRRLHTISTLPNQGPYEPLNSYEVQTASSRRNSDSALTTTLLQGSDTETGEDDSNTEEIGIKHGQPDSTVEQVSIQALQPRDVSIGRVYLNVSTMQTLEPENSSYPDPLSQTDQPASTTAE